MKSKNELKRPLIFMLLTTAIILGVYSDLNKKIILTVDGQTSKVNTLSKNVGDFLFNKKVGLKESCMIEPSIDSKLKDNMEIKITNQIMVNICDAGVNKEYKTTKQKVEDVLKECEIILNDADILNKSLNDKIKSNDTIEIIRIKEEVVVSEKEIPFKTEIVKDNSKVTGNKELNNKGENGIIEEKYKITYKNGKISSKKLVSDKIIKNPVNEVIKEGTLKVDTI